MSSFNSEEGLAVSRFREYLRINTTSLPDPNSSGPQPDYDSAVKFLSQQAEEIGLQLQCIEVYPKRPVLVMTWVGSDPSLSSIMLNSHMDVVPVFPEYWEVDPFVAHMNPNGDIVARGSQDMKCVGMWYLEAIRKLKEAKTSLLRTLHIVFTPDEEVGGKYGMAKFIEREEFKNMNVGFCLDEGLANPKNAFTVFYAERTAWWLNITCFGNPGHASRFIEDTAMEKAHKLMSLVMKFREQEEKRLNSDPSLKLGDVTTVNVTIVKGGIQHNVIPNEVTLSMDMRITPHHTSEEMEQKLQEWIGAVGGKCSLEFVLKDPPSGKTSIDLSDPWWKAFSSACSKQNITSIETEIFSAATDSRYIRRLNIPALGFSAIRNTPILLHDHNEFLNTKIYLEGIGIYQDIIASLANVK